jgi:excisionase family DNA binding protein
MADDLLTPDEVAKMFRCSRRTILNMIYNGHIKFIRLSRGYRIKREEALRHVPEGLPVK